MEIHQTGNRADWQSVPSADRNRWQRLAAATHGYVTPGNGASVVGAGLTILGFLWLYQGRLRAGAIAIIIGRLGDVLDGYIAHHTGTKSVIGETLDAAADKVVLLVALVVLFILKAVPVWLLIPLGVQQLIVGILGIYVRLAGKRLHPSLVGKVSAIAIWVVLSGYVVTVASHHTTLRWLTGTLHALLAVSILIGFRAMFGYLRSAGKSS